MPLLPVARATEASVPDESALEGSLGNGKPDMGVARLGHEIFLGESKHFVDQFKEIVLDARIVVDIRQYAAFRSKYKTCATATDVGRGQFNNLLPRYTFDQRFVRSRG